MLARRLDLLEKARAIARDVGGPNAAAVDQDGRFPVEALQALKDANTPEASNQTVSPRTSA